MACQSYAAVGGRILLSVMFLLSGFGKLADRTGTIQYIESAGLPFPSLAYLVSLVCEIGGGLAILVGFKARWAAAVLFVFTLAAGLSFHAHFNDQDQTIHFLKNLAIAGGFLYVVAFGAGCFSLDAWLAKKSQS